MNLSIATKEIQINLLKFAHRVELDQKKSLIIDSCIEKKSLITDYIFES